MAAAVSQIAAFKPAAARAAPARRQRLVVARAGAEQQQQSPLQWAAAGLAAAALVLGAPEPAQAGVKLVQPEVKNFVTGTEPAAAPAAAKAAAKKAAPRVSEMSGGPDLRFLALPVSVVGIAAAGVAASKVDSGFLEVLNKGALRDNNVLGVGYEANSGLKDSYFFEAGGPKEVRGVPGAGRAAPKAAGTKSTKAAGTKKGGFFGSRG